MRAVLLWVALLVAFSPVLADLAGHLVENPWARYAAVFPLLFARCALREPRPARQRADGALLVAAGVALELFASFVGAVRFARPGLALAAVGLCRRFALASPGSQVLLLFAIPLPSELARIGHPELPSALLSLGAAVLSAAGLPFEVRGMEAHLGGVALVLEREDGGATLAALLAGLSWYTSRLLSRPPTVAVAWAALAALLAIPLQAAAIALALLLLDSGDASLARQTLTHAPWIAATLAAVARAELRARRAR